MFSGGEDKTFLEIIFGAQEKHFVEKLYEGKTEFFEKYCRQGKTELPRNIVRRGRLNFIRNIVSRGRQKLKKTLSGGEDAHGNIVWREIHNFLRKTLQRGRLNFLEMFSEGEGRTFSGRGRTFLEICVGGEERNVFKLQLGGRDINFQLLKYCHGKKIELSQKYFQGGEEGTVQEKLRNFYKIYKNSIIKKGSRKFAKNCCVIRCERPARRQAWLPTPSTWQNSFGRLQVTQLKTFLFTKVCQKAVISFSQIIDFWEKIQNTYRQQLVIQQLAVLQMMITMPFVFRGQLLPLPWLPDHTWL